MCQRHVLHIRLVSNPPASCTLRLATKGFFSSTLGLAPASRLARTSIRVQQTLSGSRYSASWQVRALGHMTMTMVFNPFS